MINGHWIQRVFISSVENVLEKKKKGTVTEKLLKREKNDLKSVIYLLGIVEGVFYVFFNG